MARRVGKLTVSAGLAVAGYASYYRVGASERSGLAFEKVLETAAHLQASFIRVWAGIKPSADTDEAYANWIIDEAGRIAELAAAADLKIACECHAGTLTDSLPTIANLLKKVQHPNWYFLWQPAEEKALSHNLQTLTMTLPRLANVHVRPSPDWRKYFTLLRPNPTPRYALLEFIQGHDPAQLPSAVQTVRAWLTD
jgi:hypothetical protein